MRDRKHDPDLDEVDTHDSYGANEEEQTREREQAGNRLDEAGEPTDAQVEEAFLDEDRDAPGEY
jgi:hypothetical protein